MLNAGSTVQMRAQQLAVANMGSSRIIRFAICLMLSGSKSPATMLPACLQRTPPQLVRFTQRCGAAPCGIASEASPEVLAGPATRRPRNLQPRPPRQQGTAIDGPRQSDPAQRPQLQELFDMPRPKPMKPDSQKHGGTPRWQSSAAGADTCLARCACRAPGYKKIGKDPTQKDRGGG